LNGLAEQTSETVQSPASPGPARSVLVEVPVLLAVAIVIALVMKAFVAQAFFIPSASMVPQLEIHDRVVVSKLSYRLHDPRRGDIVVFACPPGADCTVRPPLHEVAPVRWLRDLGEAMGLLQPRRDEFIKRVLALPGETVEGRDGHVYVDGKLVVEPYLPDGVRTSSFPPTVVPAGMLWVMGDNRGNSEDSRRFGPIRRRTVVGRTVFRIWPLNHMSFL
jgi:signal peptidase I